MLPEPGMIEAGTDRGWFRVDGILFGAGWVKRLGSAPEHDVDAA